VFVNFVFFPPIREGKDAEFQEWFTWSNEGHKKFEGFISRKLLKPRKEGNCAAVIEHQNRETFMAMHSRPFHEEASQRVKPLFDGLPSPHFYEVIIG
jgi:heme-degrading monooxygenase HmoA